MYNNIFSNVIPWLGCKHISGIMRNEKLQQIKCYYEIIISVSGVIRTHGAFARYCIPRLSCYLPLMSAFSNRTQITFSFSSVGGAPVYALS